ncbi:MAG: hypothetical protein WCY05_01710 [Candidatus Omnitrophota bacterium]
MPQSIEVRLACPVSRRNTSTKPIIFSLQVDFLRQRSFVASAARKLARLLAGSNILAVQMLIPHLDSLATKAALAKIDIALKNHQFHSFNLAPTSKDKKEL